MANEVSPDLKQQIEDYLTKRGKGETETLAFFYKQIFGRELNIKCGGCIEDAVQHLKQRIKNKKPPMINYKWVGNPKADVIIKQGGTTYIVSKENVTDETAAIIAGISKYAHLVERIAPIDKVEEKVIVFKPVEKKSEPELIFHKLEPTTSTLTEAQNEGQNQKKKNKKHG